MQWADAGLGAVPVEIKTAGQHAARTWYNVDGGHIYARQVADVTWT